MKRLFVKKTKNMKDGTEIKNWAETLKEAETHFTACANYCKNVKRLLKDLDSSIIKNNNFKKWEIAGNIGNKWELIGDAYSYITNEEKLKIIFKNDYKTSEELVEYINGLKSESK